jgi:hypothetical protein
MANTSMENVGNFARPKVLEINNPYFLGKYYPSGVPLLK